MKQTFSLILLILCLSNINSQNLNSDYTIINDTTSKFSSIEEILNQEKFKNKVVYIDIWDTGCKHCIVEFEHAVKLKEQFENAPIEFLYLCARHYNTRKDNARNLDNEKLWEKLILENKLKGTHILMSNKCYIEGYRDRYESEYPGNIHWGIPQYLLVDKQGNIVNFLAPRPSNKDKITQEIKTLL
ncbi:TlpA family protein disulfide reductase [Carboxylicivirga taeanensis]|uniref:TlpA family protein disulfide reductase n=1 Tax=Carboxylicivirga taeanensis TaxID=1416875 RepID=UPI003F6DCA25